MTVLLTMNHTNLPVIRFLPTHSPRNDLILFLNPRGVKVAYFLKIILRHNEMPASESALAGSGGIKVNRLNISLTRLSKDPRIHASSTVKDRDR